MQIYFLIPTPIKAILPPKFRKLLDQPFSKVREAYRVEMANDHVGSTREILSNCILKLDNHIFLIELMQMIIGSFDVIISMDLLSSKHVEVLCFKKALCLPLPNREPLIVYGDKPDRNLKIIFYMKAKKYF